MSLRKLLKKFCQDAYAELARMGELPRPPYYFPLIAENIVYTEPLSQLDSYRKLQQFMYSSELSDKLHDVGHTWLWHSEVFEWLFLERVIQQNGGVEFDEAAFDEVFKRAQAELRSPSFKYRRITVLTGLPQPQHSPRLGAGIRLVRMESFSTARFELADLLGWQFQDINRAPPLEVDPDSCFLVQERVITKGNRGRHFLDSRKQIREEANSAITALRLAVDAPIYAEGIFSCYLSTFPLFPVSYAEVEELVRVSFSLDRSLTQAEVRDIKSILRFITQANTGTPEQPFFQSALNKFSDSYRISRNELNVVDLAVALEGLFHVPEEELSRRLATYVALLLAVDDSVRQELYRKVKAGYGLRSTIVHGQKDQAKEMSKALRAFFPELRSKPAHEVLPSIEKATRELRHMVRRVLTAYIYMRTQNTRQQWPAQEDFEYLPFNSHKRNEIQKQLGITRKTWTPSKVTIWRKLD